MKTKLKLHGMRFRAYHGVLPEERQIGTIYEVNMEIVADLSQACDSDDVRDTINYAEVYDLVKKEIMIPSDLIEHVAYRIFTKIKEYFVQILHLEVSVAKYYPPVNGEMEKSEIVISD